MKRASLLIVLTTSTLGLGACASEPSADMIKGGDGKFIAVVSDEASSGGEDALIEGALEIVGSCLGFSIPGADVQHLIIWPFGTSIDGEGVRLPGGSAITLGEEFQLSGGYHSSPWPGIPEDIPDECMTDEIAIVNSVPGPS